MEEVAFGFTFERRGRSLTNRGGEGIPGRRQNIAKERECGSEGSVGKWWGDIWGIGPRKWG